MQIETQEENNFLQRMPCKYQLVNMKDFNGYFIMSSRQLLGVVNYVEHHGLATTRTTFRIIYLEIY